MIQSPEFLPGPARAKVDEAIADAEREWKDARFRAHNAGHAVASDQIAVAYVADIYATFVTELLKHPGVDVATGQLRGGADEFLDVVVRHAYKTTDPRTRLGLEHFRGQVEHKLALTLTKLAYGLTSSTPLRPHVAQVPAATLPPDGGTVAGDSPEEEHENARLVREWLEAGKSHGVERAKKQIWSQHYKSDRDFRRWMRGELPSHSLPHVVSHRL